MLDPNMPYGGNDACEQRHRHDNWIPARPGQRSQRRTCDSQYACADESDPLYDAKRAGLQIMSVLQIQRKANEGKTNAGDGQKDQTIVSKKTQGLCASKCEINMCGVIIYPAVVIYTLLFYFFHVI